jgi:hypothetical protein
VRIGDPEVDDHAPHGAIALDPLRDQLDGIASRPRPLDEREVARNYLRESACGSDFR